MTSWSSYSSLSTGNDSRCWTRFGRAALRFTDLVVAFLLLLLRKLMPPKDFVKAKIAVDMVAAHTANMMPSLR